MKVKIGNYPKGKGDRKVKVEINSHDLYSLDNTLACVIYPALQAFRKVAVGSIPGSLIHSDYSEMTKAQKKQTEKNASKKWLEILDAMIWSFKTIADDRPDVGTESERNAHEQKIEYGLDLFAKHYGSLWT